MRIFMLISSVDDMEIPYEDYFVVSKTMMDFYLARVIAHAFNWNTPLSTCQQKQEIPESLVHCV